MTERAAGRGFQEAAQHCIEPQCQATYALSELVYVCRRCGGLLEVRRTQVDREYARRLPGVWEARLASMDPRDRSGVWRYRELLPFAEDVPIVTLAEGNTPLYDAPRAAAYCRIDSLLLKHQGLNPTSSFKDTGMTTAVTQAGILGVRALVCASTGNTAASLAAYAARAHLQCAILVPRGQVSFAKLAQSLDYGAVVLEIEGNFDVAMNLVRELGEEPSVYLVNSINPFRIEGQKTVAVELLEQCQWRVPDHVVVPGGNLGNSSALGKGFLELFDLGIIERLPRLSVIQAEGAAPFTELFTRLTTERADGGFDSDLMQPVDNPHTLATAIKIGAPVSWKKSLAAVLRTGGQILSVSEQEIADAKAIIGRDGIGCEPASATTVAGIKRLVSAGKIGPGEMVVAVLTGHLLKDTEYVINYYNGTLQSRHTGKVETISSRFGNRAVQVKATKDAILEQLRRAGNQDVFGGRRDT